MFRGIGRIFTHQAAGPAWAMAAVVMALALAVIYVQARREEDFLRGRIAALATHDASQLQAELVSCRATVRSYAAAVSATAAGRVPDPGHATPVRAFHQDPRAVAAALAATPPAGFDVCARMESADQAVLRSLER